MAWERTPRLTQIEQPQVKKQRMNSHEIDYKIYGDDMQIVSIELDPKKMVIAEAGSMNWMDTEIKFEAKMGDGSQPDKGILKTPRCGKTGFDGRVDFLDPLHQ